MGTSTSTGTLTAGTTRTFDLAPASAVTLTLLPNVRVTITESPATVTATGLGGNATRVHEPRLPGVVTYGPYPMGGSVVVEVGSNSGSSVTWVYTSASFSVDSTDGAIWLVSPDSDRVLIAQDQTATVMSDEIVRVTSTGNGGSGGPGYVSRIRCITGTSVALTVQDNPGVDVGGTVIYSGTLSAGEEAVLSAAKVPVINGTRLTWAGSASFDVYTGQETP